MRGYRIVLAFLLGAGSFFVWNHLKAQISSNLSPDSAPVAEPPPLPPTPLTPAQTSAKEVLVQYFQALNQHDFDTAYQFLSAAWGVDRQSYERYWRQFDIGSIQAKILLVTQRSEQSTAITSNWSGASAGKSVTVQFRCELSETATSHRIDRCQQKVLRGILPR